MAKKNWIKIWIVMVIVFVICFSDWSFAIETENLETVDSLLDFFVGVLSWIWILFAKLAWIFLTNNRVYGETLKMDGLFWQYWNVTKNIANFWLWFYFIYIIFKWLINQGKEDIVKNIKKKILWVLIAWVGIQASRFFTAAVVDISTITLVAVWSLPSQLIAWNSNIQESVENSVYEYFGTNKESVGTWRVVDLFPKAWKSSEFVVNTMVSVYESWAWELTKQKFFDLLLPDPEDVSWPLYFIGFSILRTNEINSLNSNNQKTLKGALFNLVIQWWTTIIYSIEMWVLCILALMRLLYLWMFIILSPIAIFLWCLKMSKDEDVMKWSFVEGLMEQINIKSFLINVFKPTIIVLWLWLAMIFASLMNNVINMNDKPVNDVDIWWITVKTIENPRSGLTETDLNYTTSIEGGTIKFTLTNVAKWILEFIMCIITVVLVYIIIRIAVKMGWNWSKDFVSQKIWKVQDAVQWVLESTPVVPVAWYDEKTGAPTTHFVSAGKVWTIFDKASNKFRWKVQDEYNKQNNIISSWLGNNSGYLSSDEVHKIENAGIGAIWLNILTAKKNIISTLKSEEWKWMTLNLSTASNNGFWIKQFGVWLTNMKGKEGEITGTNYNDVWKEMIKRWNGDEANKIEEGKRMQTMFTKISESAVAYSDFFWLNWWIHNWDDLKDEDISKWIPSEKKS